jgi:hypothetical protein
MQEQNPVEWQAPPPPEEIKAAEPPQMSEAATLANIFFEPGRTFEDLRRKPRFILATVIICLLTSAFMFAFTQKMGEDRYRRFAAEQLEKNPQAGSMTAEQKQQSVSLQLTVIRILSYILPVFVIIGIALGGLMYWLGGKAMGGTLNYHAGKLYRFVLEVGGRDRHRRQPARFASRQSEFFY